jgi:cbb3-type cytochrome oxidase maturation protein
VNLLGLIAISLALGVLSWLAFLWSVRSGQYEDPEGPKYRMLDDEEDEAPPPRAAPSGETQADAPVGEPRGDDQPRTPGVAAPDGQAPDRP